VPNFYGLPGLEANAFTLKTLQDATGLRNHVISLLERADVEQNETERRRLLTFVVAGAGFAGVEILASLFDMAHSILRYYPEIPRHELRFILVHSQSRILPELSPELAAYAQRKLENRGLEFVLDVRVIGTTPDKVLLNNGSHLPTCTLVWTAGNQPNPLLRTLPGELDRRGAVLTDSTLRAKGLINVWAVGDCAVIPDVDNEGQPFPPTAQHALREGKVVAENIAAVLRGKSPKPFRFKTIGLLVSLGHRTAAAEILGHRFSGLLAWFMWRTIYWGKLPGLEKKMRVAIDWAIDLFFPRDIVLTMNPVVPRPSARKNHDDERNIGQTQPIS
jgi:NADH dehydrogenase